MFARLRIRTKFILIFLFIGTLPMLTATAINYLYSKKQIENSIFDSLQAINIARETNINHLITLRQEQAKELAGSLPMRQLRTTGANRPEVIQSIQRHINLVFFELQLSSSHRYQSIDHPSDIELIAVWDTNGHIVASNNEDIVGRKMPSKFQEPVREKGLHFGGYQVDPSTGKKYILIMNEIRNLKSNKHAGSIVIFMNMEFINDITTSYVGLGETGESYIVNTNNHMLTNARHMDNQFLKTIVQTQATNACLSDAQGGQVYQNYHADEVIGVSRHLTDMNWCLVTEMHKEEAFYPIARLRSQTTQIAFMFLFLIVLAAIWASRKFVQPLLKLSDASQKIGEGHYDGQVELTTQDEIGDLADAFNNMTEKLAHAKKMLLERNEELKETLELTNEQKKIIEKVNLEMDRYVSIVSHDIASPINGLILCANNLKNKMYDQMDDRGKKSLDVIIRGAGKLKRITDSLLQMTKITKIKNPFEMVSSRIVLNSSLDRLIHEIELKNIEVVVQEELPHLVCDPIKLETVLYNLINNAIKYSASDRQIEIEVGCRELDEHFEFYVKDNGIGIDARDQEKVFDIFNRLTHKHSVEGAGVGLFLVKTIVDEHQGRIWLESKENEGTCFYFTISKHLNINSEETINA